MWLLILLLSMLLLFGTTFSLRLDIQHDRGKLQLLIRLSWRWIHKDWQLTLHRSPKGHLISRDGSVPFEVSAASIRGSRHERFLKALLQSIRTRRFLLQHIRLSQLDVSLRLHHDNAAATALLTGFLRSLWAFLPTAWRGRTRLLVIPEFATADSSLSARCILHFRLGTLLITAGMLFLSRMAGHAGKAREAGIWNTPSEN